MGTKRNPGRFDCYANAEPDEPMFVLLARDPLAPWLVRLWEAARHQMKPELGPFERDEKAKEARACADAMARWAWEHGKVTRDDAERAATAFARARFLDNI